MKDFKKGGFERRDGGRPSFGGKPAFKKFGSDRNSSDRPQVMHTATCANCGKTCEVPFRPNGEKPVFCNDCFAEKRDGQSYDRPAGRPERRDFAPRSFDRPERRTEPRSDFRPAAPAPDRRIDDMKMQIDAMNVKLDRLMGMMVQPKKESTPAPLQEAGSIVKKEKPSTKAAVKKVVKPTVKAPAKKEVKKKVVAKKK